MLQLRTKGCREVELTCEGWAPPSAMAAEARSEAATRAAAH